MTTYALKTLLKLREYKNTNAEITLQEASHYHVIEQEKLTKIQHSLHDVIIARKNLHNKFLLKAQISPCNKREVSCHILSRQKNMCDEYSLRKSLSEQEKIVENTAIKLEIAKNYALEANRNLKLIEKHYISWQKQVKRSEEIKEEYETDDQNGVRFILKKVNHGIKP